MSATGISGIGLGHPLNFETGPEDWQRTIDEHPAARLAVTRRLFEARAALNKAERDLRQAENDAAALDREYLTAVQKLHYP